MKDTFAPGWPGIPARWTSSSKSGLGTAVSRDSRVWFTLSHGILNEIYYPRVDHACTRHLGFIVTDGQTFFSEEKRDARSETLQVAPGIPAYRILNVAVDDRYRIEKEVLTEPWRDVVLQRIRFVPLQGTLADFRLYVLLAPPRIWVVVIRTSFCAVRYGLACSERRSTPSSRSCSRSTACRDLMSGMTRRTSFARLSPTAASIRPPFT